MTKEELTKKAEEMAKASIYDTAHYLGQWNGYGVYEPDFNDDEIHYVGIPSFILEQNGEMRWTKDGDESLLIMDELYKDNK